jgi:hypothetical protein
LTYLDIRNQNATAYRDANRVMFLLPSWGPLTQAQFELGHKAAITELAAQGPIDWTNTFALPRANMRDAGSIVATLVTAVLNVVFPVTIPFDPLITGAIELIIKLLLSSISSSVLGNENGANSFVQQLAMEAAAA